MQLWHSQNAYPAQWVHKQIHSLNKIDGKIKHDITTPFTCTALVFIKSGDPNALKRNMLLGSKHCY